MTLQHDSAGQLHDPDAAALIRCVLTASAAPPGSGAVRLADDVLLVIVHDGSGRLIDLSGNVSAVTESGAAMLELALRHGMDAACRSLAERHRVSEDVIRADIDRLFCALEGQRILVSESAAAETFSLRRTLSWMVYPLVLLGAKRPTRRAGMRASLLAAVAFFATRAFGWTNTIRVWDRASTTLSSAHRAETFDRAAVAIIDSAVTHAIAAHLLPVSCKERALTAWVLARAAGAPAHLRLGIDLFPFGLHCWCESESHIIADRYEGRCDRFTPIASYG